MSDQNLTEEIINSESITENDPVESQDQNTLDDQELSETGNENGVIVDNIKNEIQDDNIEDEEMKKEGGDDEKEETKNEEMNEDSKIAEDKSEELKVNEDNKDEKNNDKDVNEKINDDKEEKENNEEEKENNKEDKIKEKDDKVKDEIKNKEKSKNTDDSSKNENNKEGDIDVQRSNDNKKSDKDDNNSSNKKNGSYSNNYRNDKGYNGRFMPRGHQYNHHPYDDWGRRRGGMNYPPYYEKDRRHGMRNDFRGREYRDFYDMRMERDFRGFRDRDRDFDYPKFYGRGRDQRFFNKRDRDFKYKRDYYDDYNMRNMDKDMRMNNMIRECRVYVQNLSYEVNTEMLTRFMEKVGKVVSVEILTTPDGRSKGCAVVQFETPNEARRAISDLQDNQFQGRPIHIREDREGLQYNSSVMDKGYMGDKSMGYQGEGGPSNYQNNMNNTPKEQRIFVGNLDVNVTPNDLRTLFEPAGTINYADVFQKDRNQSSKHGIIGFQDSSSIKKAIEMFNGITYRNRKLDVHEDRRGIVPVRRFNTYKSDKNMTIHNAGHHPYQPNSKPYPPGRGGKGNGSFPGKFNNNRQPPHHQPMQNSQAQKMQQPPLPPHPSNSNNQDKNSGNTYGKNQSYNQQQQNNSIAYPSHQQSNQPNTQAVAMQYSQATSQTPYMQPMATYSQSAQSTYAQPQGVQQAASVQLYTGYPMTDQSATNSNVAAYQSTYQTAAYYSSLSHQAQPVAIPSNQPVQQPYPVATNVDYNNLYSAYYGQTSQVGASGYPMMTQSTTTAAAQGQAGYTEGSTLPTTYSYY